MSSPDEQPPATAIPAAPPSRHSVWRMRRSVGRVAHRALWLRRAAATAVLLLLCAALYFAVAAPFEHPHLHLAALTTLADGNAPAPDADTSGDEVPFVPQDLAAWQALAAQLAPESRSVPMFTSAEPQSAADLEALGAQLDRLQTNERDVLLLYVRTEGTVVEGAPQLLCRKRTGNVDPSEPYPLQRMLNQLAARPFAVKLLVLDSGAESRQSSPLLNEFPRLVSASVAQTGDPTLWVLHSHGLLESSHVMWSRQRTILSDAVTHGLSGAADVNRDQSITVDELFRFTSHAVLNATLQLSNGQATQTPQLAWGAGEVPDRLFSPVLAPVGQPLPLPGVDIPGQAPTAAATPAATPLPNPFQTIVAGPVTVTPPVVPTTPTFATLSGGALSRSVIPTLPAVAGLPQVTVTPVTPAALIAAKTAAPIPAPAPAAPAASPATAPPDAAAKTADDPAKEPDDAAPDAAAPDTAAPDTAAQNAALAAALVELWRLRDRLESRDTGRLTPIDVAPRQWRALLNTLQSIERRCRTQSVADVDALLAEIRDMRDALTAILERQPLRTLADDRSELWQSLSVNTSLPPVGASSIALSTLLAARGGEPVPEPLATSWQQLATAIQAADRGPFDAWLTALPPEFAARTEFAGAVALAQCAELDWPLLRDALEVQQQAEFAAARWELAPMVRQPVAAGDEFRLAAERLLTDGVAPDRQERAALLLEQARAQYRTALANADLLSRARILYHDASFRAPDYVRWWADTALAMYRCGPAATDVARLLTELRDLGALLRSGDLNDHDQLQIKVGLVEGIVARIDVAGCARMNSERRTTDASRDTPWQLQALLNTPLPQAELRLRLLSEMTDVEARRLASAPAVVAAAPIPERSLSLRDWHYLETHAQLRRDLAALSAVGLPDGERLLTSLDREVAEKRRCLAALLQEQDRMGDALFAHLRVIDAALATFDEELIAATQRITGELRARGERGYSVSDPELLEIMLHAERVNSGRVATLSGDWNPGRQLLKLQTAQLLAWEADRAAATAINADPDAARYSLAIAARLRAESNALRDSDGDAPATPPALSIVSDADPELIAPTAQVQVTVATTASSAIETWVVLEYDPELIRVDAPVGIPVYHEPQLAASYLARGALAADAARPGQALAPRTTSGPPLPTPDGAYAGSWWSSEIVHELPRTSLVSERQPLGLTFNVRRLAVASRPVRLVVKAVTSRHFARRLVEFRVPRPPFADLQLAGIEGTFDRADHGLSLYPFPNQDTEFRARIVNLLPAARVVDVTLLSLNRPLDVELPPGTVNADEAATLLDSLPTAGVAAKWDERPLPPPGTAATEPAAAEPPPEPPADPAKAPPLPDLTFGAVAVISDHTTKDTVFVPIGIEPQRPSRYVRPVVRYNLTRERVEIDIRAESAAVLPAQGTTVRAEFVEPIDPTATFLLDGVLQAPSYRTSLFAEVPTAPRKVVHLQLHIDGYPRAFQYTIPCDRDSTTVPQTTDNLSVRLLKPDIATPFLTPADGIPVRLELDAPHGAFASLPTLAEIGLDVNRDRLLDNEPRLQLRGDRQVDVRLKGWRKDGTLILKTTLDDYQVMVPAQGLGTARVNVLGRVQVGSEVVWSDPREIILDGTPPTIQSVELRPDRILTSEQKLQVLVRADDRLESGVAKVQLTFDVLRTGEFPPEAKIIEAGATDGPYWSADVPLADLPPGAHGLLIRAVDATGNVSDVHREIVRILSPDDAKSRMLAATSPVFGTVMFGQTPVPNADVVLADDKQQEVAVARSNTRGEFEMPRVAPGAYKLTVTALMRNKNRTAEAPVAVPPPPEQLDAIDLQLR